MSFTITWYQQISQSAASPGDETPVISASDDSWDEDSSGDIPITYSGSNPNPVNWSTLAATVLSGNITASENTPTDGTIRITPAANWNGNASISVTVQDDQGNTSEAIVINILVNAVADKPVISTSPILFNEDGEATATLIFQSDDDADPNWASLTITLNPASLTLTLNYLQNGDIRVQAPANYNGTTSFTVTVEDENGVESDPLQIDVTIAAVPDDPVLANPIAMTANEDNDATIDLNDSYSSPDSAAIDLTSIAVSTPTYGTLAVDTGTGIITYTPPLNWNGSDSFTVTVNDENTRTSNVATVNVTINAVNDTAIAYDHATDTFENNSVVIDLQALDLVVDLDGTPNFTTVEIGTAPSHGSTSINPTTGAITYTPATNNQTAVTFTYRLKDNSGEYSNYGTIAVNIFESWIVQAIKAESPHTYYRLNETSGTSFADSSGNSRAAGSKSGSGTIGVNGGTAPDGAPAVEITADDQYINLTDTNTWGVFNTGNFSLLLFFAAKTYVIGGGTGITLWQFREGGSSNNQIYNGVTGAAKAQTFFKVGGTTTTDTVTSVPVDNNWHNMGFSFDDAGDIVYLWLDSAANGTKSISPSPNVVSTPTLRIGNNAGSPSGMLLAHWALFAETKDEAAIAEMTDPTIQNYASLRYLAGLCGVPFGWCLPNSYASQSSLLKNIVQTEASYVVSENALKYSNLLPTSRNQTPAYSSMDAIKTMANTYHMRYKGHVGWWPTDSSISWLNSETKTKANARAIMREKAQIIFERYTDMYAFDVVNETILDSDPGGSSLKLKTTHVWADFYGNTTAGAYEWICDAFTICREFNSTCKLLIGDYRIERYSHWKGTAMRTLISRLLTDGIPVDGVAMQSHFDLDTTGSGWSVNTTELANQVAAIKALGVECHSSELDVKIWTDAVAPLASGTETAQAQAWYDAIDAMVGAGIDSILCWAVGDSVAALGSDGSNPANQTLHYITSYDRKPAYYKAAQAFWDNQS